MYSKFSFSINSENFSINEILKEENKVKIFPVIIELIKKKEIKLIDYIEHHMKDKNKVYNIDERISLILQLLKNPNNLAIDKAFLIKKIKENDFEWIMENLIKD